MKISTSEARRNFAELIARVERGEEVILTRRGQEVAKLSPLGEPQDTFPDMSAFRQGLKVTGEPISETVVRLRQEERY